MWLPGAPLQGSARAACSTCAQGSVSSHLLSASRNPGSRAAMARGRGFPDAPQSPTCRARGQHVLVSTEGATLSHELTASVQPVPAAARNEPGQSRTPAPEVGGPGVPEVLAPFFQFGKGSVKSSPSVFLKTRVDWLSDQCLSDSLLLQSAGTACCEGAALERVETADRLKLKFSFHTASMEAEQGKPV